MGSPLTTNGAGVTLVQGASDMTDQEAVLEHEMAPKMAESSRIVSW